MANEELEIKKLEQLLLKANIPFVKRKIFTGEQIIYPNKDKWVCDAVCHAYSYGGDQGLLEIMGLVDGGDDEEVQGYLTADQVFKKIQDHWEKHCL